MVIFHGYVNVYQRVFIPKKIFLFCFSQVPRLHDFEAGYVSTWTNPHEKSEPRSFPTPTLRRFDLGQDRKAQKVKYRKIVKQARQSDHFLTVLGSWETPKSWGNPSFLNNS